MEIFLDKISQNTILNGSDSICKFDLGDPRFLKPEGDIFYKIYPNISSKEVCLKGEINLKVSLLCSRCSDFFSTSVHVSDFLRAYRVTKGLDRIDITNDFQEEIILNIPNFPLCTKDCAGMCFKCGLNLNKEECNCSNDKNSDAWSALDQLDL